MKRTKIVATIGPKSEHPEILKQLSEVGVNVFRLNFSHGSHEEHGKKNRCNKIFKITRCSNVGYKRSRN